MCSSDVLSHVNNSDAYARTMYPLFIKLIHQNLKIWTGMKVIFKTIFLYFLINIELVCC